MQSTAAILNYGHLEAIAKAGKRDSMEGGMTVMKIMTISILEEEKRVTSKHTHTHILAHGVITRRKTSNSILRGDDLRDYIICFCITAEDSAPQ